MDYKKIVSEGEETSHKMFESLKDTAKKAADAANKGLMEHGIDTGKLGSSLARDAKNVGNFVVGSAKVASDKVKDALNKNDQQKSEEEIKREAIMKIEAMKAAQAMEFDGNDTGNSNEESVNVEPKDAQPDA